MQPEQQVIQRWTGSAPFWEKHRDIIRQMFAPVTRALAEAAEIGSEHTVLDVATGPGEPALSLADVVGPAGKVVGIDPIPEMVAGARRAAGRAALRNVEFEVAFADKLPFAANAFDAAISRFGAMFFPSPVGGIKEMLRVLKPGRKIALAAWHHAERNPFHTSLAQVIDRYVEPQPVAPDALDAFRFAQPGKLLQLLREAGAREPTERLLRFTIEAAISVDEFWTLRREMSEKFREKLGALSPETLARIRSETAASLQEYSTVRGMAFPAEVLVVSGEKTA